MLRFCHENRPQRSNVRVVFFLRAGSRARFWSGIPQRPGLGKRPDSAYGAPGLTGKVKKSRSGEQLFEGYWKTWADQNLMTPPVMTAWKSCTSSLPATPLLGSLLSFGTVTVVTSAE
jgi:hypothetical protein